MDNAKENATALFLKWLRVEHPDLYQAAMQKTFADNTAAGSQLGSLGSWADTITGFFNNVTQLATTYLTDTAQVKNVSLNAGRVSQGLPPLNTNGTVMSPEQMQAAGYASATITQIEANMAKGAGSITGAIGAMPWYFWAALAAAGLWLVMRRK